MSRQGRPPLPEPPEELRSAPPALIKPEKTLLDVIARGRATVGISEEQARAETARILAGRQEADAMRRAGQLQQASKHRSPSPAPKPPLKAEQPAEFNRQLRRVRAQRKRMSRVITDCIERNRKKHQDPTWTPEAFPALRWHLMSDIKAILSDTTGRTARTMCAALPLPQAQELMREARELESARDLSHGEGYALWRWRELVAGAWASWGLSRPVRRSDSSPLSRTDPELGVDLAAQAVPPPSRGNPWSGGRVVDGYAREAFCLLWRDLKTGAPASKSKLFYRNGSGEQGPLAYLSTPLDPEAPRSKLPRVSGKLALYHRFQPRADKSRYVGPVKKNAAGEPLLTPDGRTQRYALGEHWYLPEMCGRRVVGLADAGYGEARVLLRELCPWRFADEDSREELLRDSAQREASVDGTKPSPAAQGPSEARPGEKRGSRAPPCTEAPGAV